MFRRWLQRFAIAAAVLVPAAHADVQVGEPAPDFSLIGSDGKTYSLSDFRGEQPVVIAFFPKAFTGG
ncbi:MAG: redoxin domain-containing protein [Gammaproteobacteria bacterium]|nr:redoxin domain-containing protein [Gammaproteobacteria bacterium]